MSTISITRQVPPIVTELQAIFESLPDADFIAMLRGPKRRGRPGYDPRILWRAFICYYALGIESVSALIRFLRSNPYIAEACGIATPDQMPSQPTFSRFGTRLARKGHLARVRDIQRAMTATLAERLPGFGETLAIDSTTLRGWSNGGRRGKRGKRHTVKRQRSRPGRVSDGDAGWSVKSDTHGRKKYTWGYKCHIISDAASELPVAISVTAGNVADVREASGLLRQIRYSLPRNPDYVLADAGYSSAALRRLVRRQYRAIPIIDPNPSHKRAVVRQEDIENWREIYKQRSGIERLNGRLKGFYKLDSIRVRGRTKVMLHALLSAICLEARALAFPDRLRHCVPLAA